MELSAVARCKGGQDNLINTVILTLGRKFLPEQIKTMEMVKKYRYILYSGAVRAGKTLLLAHVAIRACIENPGCTGMLGSLTTPQLTDVVFRVFQQELTIYQKALDDAGIPIQLAVIKHSKGDMKAIFWNGSVVMFKPCDDEMKLRGLTLDFVGLDEPIDIDEEIFKQLMNRISGGHIENPFILLTTNPGSQTHWIYRYFFTNKTDEYYTIETTTYDNVLLPEYEKYIKSLEDNLDEDWILRFLNGKWGAYSGQIYKHFDPDKHVGNYKDFQDIKYYIAGVDWGIRNPSCILTLGVSKDKHIYVVDEYYKSGRTTNQVAQEIADRHHKKYHYRKVYVDPSTPDLIVQVTDLKVPADKADNKVADGIGKIKSAIKANKIHIDKSCVNLIKEMQAYRYAKDKLNKNPTEEPVKEDDHAPDALRYGLTSHHAFRGIPVIGWVKKDLWDFK